MAAENVKHPTARVKRAWTSDVRSDIEAKHSVGGQVGARLDDDWGSTQPSEVVLAASEMVVEITQLGPDFRHRLTNYKIKLGKIAPRLHEMRDRLETARSALERAADETAAQLKNLPPEFADHRQGTRPHVVNLLLTVFLAAGDWAFLQAALSMTILPSFTTWSLALVAGASVLLMLHWLGGRYATATNTTSRLRLLVAGLLIPVLMLFVLSILRADYSVSEASLAGGAAGAPWWLLVAVYAAIQAVLDGAAFLLGEKSSKFNNVSVRALIAARTAERHLAWRYHVLSWRMQHLEGKAAAHIAAGQGWCDKTADLARTLHAAGIASVTAIYAGIEETVLPPEAKPVFAEQLAADHGAAQKVLEAAITSFLHEIDKAKEELTVASSSPSPASTDDKHHNNNPGLVIDYLSLEKAP